ncbi:Conserved_hypothetical protein [Hexamita inflata]|uniref:Uncharacterized protein n=1 Tax=Hexamita inflata TaxID=28002 RepID=A0AA86RIR1_9EUKA|nr:Conserved hypothetical protein [Hexamita inflata]
MSTQQSDFEDELISETPIILSQPRDGQQLHLYQYVTRPHFRPYAAPLTVDYQPLNNELQMNVPVDASNFDASSEHSGLNGITLSGTRLSLKNNTYGIFLKQNNNLLLMPVQEAYQITPNHQHTNNNEDLLPYQQNENEVFQLQTVLKTVNYKYISAPATNRELLDAVNSTPIAFDIQERQYKKYFLQNPQLQFSQKQKNIKMQLDQLFKASHVLRLNQIIQVIKEPIDQILLNLTDLCWMCRGNFVLKSKYLMEQSLGRIRDFVIMHLNGFIHIDDGNITVDNQLMKRKGTVDRALLYKAIKQTPQEISQVLELDDLVEWKNGEWIFGYDDDTEFFAENQTFCQTYFELVKNNLAEMTEWKEKEHIKKSMIQVVRE